MIPKLLALVPFLSGLGLLVLAYGLASVLPALALAVGCLALLGPSALRERPAKTEDPPYAAGPGAPETPRP